MRRRTAGGPSPAVSPTPARSQRSAYHHLRYQLSERENPARTVCELGERVWHVPSRNRSRAGSPADARLGGAEVKWRDERRAGQDLAVELVPVPGPSGPPLGVDHTFAQTTEGVAEPARRSRNEISSRGSGAIRANHSAVV